MNNQKLDEYDVQKIRNLSDFDLTMLVSEIHDHGWPTAQVTLALMPPINERRAKQLSAKHRQRSGQGG